MNPVKNDEITKKNLLNIKIIDQYDQSEKKHNSSGHNPIDKQNFLDSLNNLSLNVQNNHQTFKNFQQNLNPESVSKHLLTLHQNNEENNHFEEKLDDYPSDDIDYKMFTNDSIKEKKIFDCEEFKQYYNENKRKEFFTGEIKSWIGENKFENCIQILFEKQYVIDKILTSGGQGTVFKGFQLQEESQKAKNFAIKLSPIQSIKWEKNQQDSQNSIQQEFNKQQKIYENIKCFKYIIKRIDIFLVDNIMVEIMKLCTKDLSKFVQDRNNKISKDEIVSIINQAFHCLTEIHINEIYHFDIKPQNILLKINNQGQISLKLTDFGVSQIRGDQLTQIGGTPLFSSPEQQPFLNKTQNTNQQDAKTLNEKSDVYSMGLTFMALLGFNRDDIDNIKNGKLDEIKKSNSYKDHQDLFSFIYHFMLNKNPDQRKNSYQLAFDFYKYMGNQVNFQIERERVSKLIVEYKNNKQMNSKYMAFVYCFQGQIQQSNESFEDCIELSKKDKIDDIQYFKYLYANLLLQSKDFKRGKEILDEIKNDYSQKNSKYNQLYGDILYSLACSYEIISEYTRSIELFNLSLSQKRELFELSDHPEIADTLDRLSKIYQKLDKTKDALSLYKESLRIKNSIYSKNNLQMALSHENRSEIYYKDGQYKESKELFKEVLKIVKNFYQGDDPWVAQIYQSLAKRYSMLSKNEKSLKYDILALEMRERLYKNLPHRDLASSYHSLCIGLQKMGKYDEALVYSKKALEMKEYLFGVDNLEVAITSQYHGSNLALFGLYQEALKSLERSYETENRLLQDDHNLKTQSLHSIGLVFSRRGDTQKEYECFEKSMEMRKRLFGNKNTPWTAQSYCSMAGYYSRNGDFEKAKRYDEFALEMRMQIFGSSDHQDKADSFHSLGITYYLKGEILQGLKNIIAALKMRQSLYEGNNPRLADSYNDLAIIFLIQRFDQKSLNFSLTSLNMRINLYQSRDHQDIIYSYLLLAIQFAHLKQNDHSQKYEQLALSMYERYQKEGAPYFQLYLKALDKARKQCNYFLQILKRILPSKQGIWM